MKNTIITIKVIFEEYFDTQITESQEKKLAQKYTPRSFEEYCQQLCMTDWSGRKEKRFLSWIAQY